MDQENLKQIVLDNLKTVIDPETGLDVINMRLIEQLEIDKNGKVSYIFRPSSPLCPIAVPLALEIIKTISGIEGVTDQSISVIDYIHADELTDYLQQYLSSSHDVK